MICLLVVNFTMSELAQRYNLNSFFLSTGASIFSLSLILETAAVFILFANSDLVKYSSFKLEFKSTSFVHYLITVVLNQILVSLSFYTLSFTNLEAKGFTEKIEKELVIKTRCTKQINVVDIKSAPKSTPMSYFKQERSARSEADDK